MSSPVPVQPPLLFFIFPLLLLLHLHTTPLAVELCMTCYCGGQGSGLPIKFPFILSNTNQSHRCGYPGFELTCSNNSRTILSLPFTGQFLVQGIDYANQIVRLSDPDDCLPNRILNFNLTGSPFVGSYARNYTFLNCSANSKFTNDSPFQPWPIDCLSDGNYSTFVTQYPWSISTMMRTGNCVIIKTASAPIWWLEYPVGNPSGQKLAGDDLQLTWSVPRCESCEMMGGSCGFKSDSGLDVGCSFSAGVIGGFSKAVKHAFLLGLGIPGLVCIIALTFYINGRIRGRGYNNRHRHLHQNSEISRAFPHQNLEISLSASTQPAAVMAGLDGNTIESYPKTVLGESKRLPKPGDGTCAICLSDYQPKEILRTIPECNHYFHAQCIDEWLQMRPTCPVCRNLAEKPDGAIS